MAQTFSDDNFKDEVINSDIPVLVDFWAPWCGPCQMMTPLIEKLAKDYEGKAKIGKVNVDDNAQLAQDYEIQSIPAIKIFYKGEVVYETVGVKQEEELKAEIDKYIQ